MEDTKSGEKHEPFEMNVTWNDLGGIKKTDVQKLSFAPPSESSSDQLYVLAFLSYVFIYCLCSEPHSWYSNSAIRKAILLVRYTNFFKKYIEIRSAESTEDSLALYQVNF